jgi:hypothetical protein
VLGQAAGDAGEDLAQLLRQRQAGPDVLGDDAASLDVHRVGHELALQSQAHRARDREPCLLLSLDRGGAQVRGDDDVVQAEQRRGRGRLLDEHVHAGAPDLARAHRVGERRLVDEAAARGVDDQDTR